MRTQRSQLANSARWLAGCAVATALSGCVDLSFFNRLNPFKHGDEKRAPGASAPGNLLGVTNENRLVTFASGSAKISGEVEIKGLGSREKIVGADIRPGGTPPGRLYVLTNVGKLYTIDTSTGQATVASSLKPDPTDTSDAFRALDGTNFGVDFNPVVDRLRVVSDTGQNLRINVDTGATITDGALKTASVTRTGVTAAAYTNSFSISCRTTLFFLDTNTNRLLVTSDPNNGVLTEVGAPGFDFDGVSGFEVVSDSSGTNTAIAALARGDDTTLYKVDLATGIASSTGKVKGLDGDERLVGLTSLPPADAPAQAVGNVVGVTVSNKLISFQNGTPQKLCTSTAITNLQSSEALLGIDVRPADGKLYGLSSLGNIYTIDSDASSPAFGGATRVAALKGTGPVPFVGLLGTEFGFDFNPVADRLRIVSDAGQNLRINVDTGDTLVDGTLTPPGSAVTAAGYTNSVAGATTTMLYVLDVARDQLMLQNPPNAGTLQTVGPLNLGDAQAIASLEINGLTSLALVAVSLANASTSDLYTVNLKTGAATRVNTIGGGERVRGIAFAPVTQAKVSSLTRKSLLTGSAFTEVAGFDIAGGDDGVSPAALRPAGATQLSTLFSIDPLTGAALSLGAIGTGGSPALARVLAIGPM